MTESEPMTGPRIVVGVDGSASATRALRWAADEARLRQLPLHVVHAWMVPFVEPGGLSGGPMVIGIVEEASRKLLEEAVASIDSAHLPAPVHGTLVCGGAAGALLQNAEGAELLVVGARGHGGFAGLLLGSVSDQVVRHAPCPVVVVPATD